MRILMILVFLFFQYGMSAQKRNLFQEKKNAKETRLNQRKNYQDQSKMFYRPEFFRMSLASGKCVMNSNGGNLNIQIGFGSGIEMILGRKIHKNIALGVGFNVMNYGINQTKFEQELLNSFQNDHFKVSLTSRGQISLTKSAMLLYGSYWNYRPKSVFEFFGKCNFTYSNYNMNRIVLINDTTSSFSAIVVLKEPIKIMGVMPSVGINYSLKLNKVLYFTAGAEYGYNISSSAFSKAEWHFANSNEIGMQKIRVPSPVHFVQLNLGFTFKPFNRIFPKEKEYSTIDFDKNKIQNR